MKTESHSNENGNTTIEAYANTVIFGLPVCMTAEFGPAKTILSANFGDLSFGEILRYLVELACPGFELDLDPPWNVLDRVNMKHIKLQMDVTGNRFGFQYDDAGLDLVFIRINKIELWYRMISGENARNRVDVNLYGKFLGQDFTDKPLSWDVLSQRAPDVPGAGLKTFDLDYLGLGQNVTLAHRDQFTTLTSVINELIASYEVVQSKGNPLSSLPKLKYQADCGWLVGTRFSILDTFTLGILFNDPVLYGLHLELRGERAKKLAGLSFDILYRKIVDGLGVFHIELTLPSAMRQFEIGSASITLPVIVVDIFTNGDFKVDFGFPYHLDFSRSFTLQFFAGPVPVLGSGGFYFGALDACTSTDVPQITNGTFSPVITFGVGLRLGVGKTFDKGILKAGIIIAVEGALEGVLAFFRPDDPALPQDTYYRVVGIVGVVGHVYGSVDFGIASAAVDLWARASAQLTLETYGSATVVLEASVSVSIRVKIVFIKVSFSFNATIRESIELSRASKAPWITVAGADARLGRFLPAATQRFMSKYDVPYTATNCAIMWNSTRVVDHRPTIDLYLQPIVTTGMEGDRPQCSMARAEQTKLIPQLCAALFVSSRRDATTEPDVACFDDIARILLRWAIDNVKNSTEIKSNDTKTVEYLQIQKIYRDLVNRRGREPLDVCTIIDFLRENFQFVIHPFPQDMTGRNEQAEKDWTIFPMLPFLTLSTGDEKYIADFWSGPKCSSSYREVIAEYYDRLKPDTGADERGRRAGISALREQSNYSMTTYLLVDYMVIVLRHVLQSALDQFENYQHTAEDNENLKSIAKRFYPELNQDDVVSKIIWANTVSTTFLKADAEIVIATQRTALEENETITSISSKLCLSGPDICPVIKDSALLTPGTTILVPGASYRLRFNDNLNDLASKFNTQIDEIKRANQGFAWEMPGNPNLLPEGREIVLPATYCTRSKDTIESIIELFGITADDFIKANADINGLLKPPADIAIGMVVQIRSNENLHTLAERVAVDETALALYLLDRSNMLATGSVIVWEKGTYIIRWNDTIDGITGLFGLSSPDELIRANPEFDWKPRPNCGQMLPAGRKIKIPAFSYTVKSSDTLRQLATRFGVSTIELVNDPVILLNNQLLAPGYRIRVPAGRITLLTQQNQNEHTLLSIAERFGLSAYDIGIVNQNTAFGVVKIPEIKEMQIDDLVSLLDKNNSFETVASIVTQFLMNGLRLPDPAKWPENGTGPHITTDTPLYPLYTLSGQQWNAPDMATTGYDFTLKLNDSTPGCTPPSITFESPYPNNRITIALTEQEVNLLQSFKDLVKNGSPLLKSLSITPLSPFEQVPMRFGIGKPVIWHTPEPFIIDKETYSAPLQLFMLSDALRSQLAKIPDSLISPCLCLKLNNGYSPDESSADTSASTVPSCWAIRVDVSLRRVADPGNPDNWLPFVYEVFSAAQDGRERLLSLLNYLKDDTSGAKCTEINLLFATPTTDNAAGIRSDAVDRSQIKLIRANLSTETRGPDRNISALLSKQANSASLDTNDTINFLQLLWQAGITNNGGYYLHYQTTGGSGFPDNLFNESGSGKLTILSTVRFSTSKDTIPILPFHNCVVVAKMTDSTRTSLFIEPPKEKADTEFCQNLAALVNDYISIEQVVDANSTIPDIFPAGTLISVNGQTYTTQIGDTLLKIAQSLGTLISDVTFQQYVSQQSLRPGAELWKSNTWMVRHATNLPGQAGFQILRNNPEKISDNEPTAIKDFELLFNSMGFKIEENDAFNCSSEGLPVCPAKPVTNLDKVEITPWEYKRLIPVSRFAKSVADSTLTDINPYSGLGKDALLSFEMHDILGNRCPLPPTDMLKIPIRYTDSLRGPDQWTGVMAGYDLVTTPEKLPVLLLRAAADSGRYVSGVAEAFEQYAAKASADLTNHVLIGYQLNESDIVLECETSFSIKSIVDRKVLIDFLGNIRGWMKTVAAMRDYETSADTFTLADISSKYNVAITSLAQANADRPVLLEGADIIIPYSIVVIQNDSFQSIYDRAQKLYHGVSISGLAELNSCLPLRAGIRLLIKGVEYVTKENDSLQNIARHHHGLTAGDIAGENLTVQNLFCGGMPILAEVDHQKINAGDTFRIIAARESCPLTDLAIVNSHSKIFATEAVLAIPQHVIFGDDTGSSCLVRQNDTLQIIAEAAGLPVSSIVRANQNVCDLIVVGKHLVYGTQKIKVQANDTLSTVLERFRQTAGINELTITELAMANKDITGLLKPQSRYIVPPRPVEIPIQIALKYPDTVAFPLKVGMKISRNMNNLDHNFDRVSGVASTVADLKPLTGPLENIGDQVLDIQSFSRTIAGTLPGIRLATTSRPAGKTDTSSTLMAVNFAGSIVSYSINPQPFFFAVPPISTTLWNSAFDAKTVFCGIDLDIWGRRFLEDIDRLLSPGFASAIVSIAKEEYDQLIQIKEDLAKEISKSVCEIVESPEGFTPDLNAAIEVMHQQMLSALSSAYSTDVLVQYQVAVHSPWTDPANAPRLSGSVVGQNNFKIPADATLGNLSTHLELPFEVLIAAIGPKQRILTEGFKVVHGKRTRIVQADDSLESIAKLLNCAPIDLAMNYRETLRLLKEGSNLDLTFRKYSICEGDTFDSVLLQLAPQSSGPEKLAGLVDRFLEVNQNTPDLLCSQKNVSIETWVIDPGDTLKKIASMLATTPVDLAIHNKDNPYILRANTIIKVGDKQKIVAERETLQEIACKLQAELQDVVAAIAASPDILNTGSALYRISPINEVIRQNESIYDLTQRINVPARQFVETQLTVAQLLQFSSNVRLLDSQSSYTVSDVKVSLVNGDQSGPKSSLTFSFENCNDAQFSSVSQTLCYEISELEFEIEDTEQEGYQASKWLTFVEPIHDCTMGHVSIPIPLRTFPIPPSMLNQCTRRSSSTGRPLVNSLREYDYSFSYAYQRAAQDKLDVRVEIGSDTLRSQPGDDDPLPNALANYMTEADRLRESLSILPNTLNGHPDQQTLKRLKDDIECIINKGKDIAEAWKKRAVWANQMTGMHQESFKHQMLKGDILPAEPHLTDINRLRPSRRLGKSIDQIRISPKSATLSTEIGADDVYTYLLQGLDVLYNWSAQGYVNITRNAELIAGCPTKPQFVYFVNSHMLNKCIPFLQNYDPLDIAKITRTSGVSLIDQLILFFRLLLDAKQETPENEKRYLSFEITYGIPVSVDSGLYVSLPAILAPMFEFRPAVDLQKTEGFCYQIATKMEDWLMSNKPEMKGAKWMFKIQLFNHDDNSPEHPLLTLSNLYLFLDDIKIRS